VVDTRALFLGDKQAVWGLPADFYLASELRQPEDLEQADFLVREDAQAFKSLDLFLGTHGWRRFVHPAPGKVVGDDSRSLMLAEGPTALLKYDNRVTAEKKLAPQLERAREKLLADARSRRMRLETERGSHVTAGKAAAQAFKTAGEAVTSARRDLNEYRDEPRQWFLSGAGVVVLFL